MQASKARSAVCKHVACDESLNLQNEDDPTKIIIELKGMYQEIQQKYSVLENVCESMKRKIKELENKRTENNKVHNTKSDKTSKTSYKSAVTATPEAEKRTKSDVNKQVKTFQPTSLEQPAAGLRPECIQPGPSNKTQPGGSGLQPFLKDKAKSNKTEEVPTLTDGEDDKNKWQKVSYGRKKKRIERPKPVNGTNENKSDLIVASKISWVFLSGLDSKMEPKDIINCLKLNAIEGHVVFDKMVTKKDKYRSSFKLGIPYENKDAVLSSGLWHLA